MPVSACVIEPNKHLENQAQECCHGIMPPRCASAAYLDARIKATVTGAQYQGRYSSRLQSHAMNFITNEQAAAAYTTL